MHVRRANVGDADSISTLVSQLSDQFICPNFGDAGRETLLGSMTPEKVAQYLADDFEFHLAEDNGELVGVVGMRGEAHLYYLFVREDHQQHGLARQLWEMMRDARLAQGVREFTVNASSNAVPVYERFGFCCTGERMEHGGAIAIPMRWCHPDDLD